MRQAITILEKRGREKVVTAYLNTMIKMMVTKNTKVDELFHETVSGDRIKLAVHITSVAEILKDSTHKNGFC